MTRTQYAIKNTKYGILSKLCNLLLSFASRTVFVRILGNTYLGVNGLYSEILSLLSFAELGFGAAMTFAMYKPVAEQDHERVVKLLDFYKKIYRIIAFVIAGLGLSLVPFLHKIVKGADWLTIRELRLYFLIFLFNTVVGYFVTYKYSYLNALQRNYIQTNISTIVSAVNSVAQITVILTTRNFLAYLLINSAVLTISRFVICIYLNKHFPILKEKPTVPLSKNEQQPIFKEVRGLAVHQFSSVAVHSTDNILISTLTEAGVVAVGYISNYSLLINSVLGFVTIIFGSVTSGFGNMAAIESPSRFCRVFKQINFAGFWIYGFCTIAFWILIPPFITLWIGADKLIDEVSFALIILNTYLVGQSGVYNNARIAKGDFGRDKNWALAQALVNLIVSIIAAKKLGLVGIYVGTIVSRLVYVLFRPFSTYRFLFEKSSAEYYQAFVKYLFWTILAAIVTRLCTNYIFEVVSIKRFIIATIVVAVLPNAIFLILSHRTTEFSDWKGRFATLINRIHGRENT